MVNKNRKWTLVGVLVISTLFAGCSTPSASSQKTDQTKVEEGKVDQVNSLDVTKMKVDQYFPNHEGIFILRDIGTNQTFVYNEERAKVRQSPNSTFKVANALIGTQVGAVKDEYEVKRWDGVKRDLDVWNKDHTLAG
jgi:beta-lactamase class D